MPVELALDLVALALYDIVIYADDSTSMKYAENGARIDDMKVILERVTEVATLFDDDGRCKTALPPYLQFLQCIHAFLLLDCLVSDDWRHMSSICMCCCAEHLKPCSMCVLRHGAVH